MTFDFSSIPQSSWRGRFSRRLLNVLPRGLVLPVLQGPMRGAWWVVGLGNHGCWLGSYELDLQLYLSRELHEGMVFWDVGANVGFYTLLGARRVRANGRVVAIEPVPGNVAGLRRIVRLNRIGGVVRVVEAAVGSRDGVSRLDPSRGAFEGRLDERGSLSVELVRMDSLLERGCPAPAVVKMDIEGAESDAFRGARRLLSEVRPLMCVATHGETNDLACRQILDASGYSVSNLEGHRGPVSDVLVARPS